jgi:hypothetical protein
MCQQSYDMQPLAELLASNTAVGCDTVQRKGPAHTVTRPNTANKPFHKFTSSQDITDSRNNLQKLRTMNKRIWKVPSFVLERSGLCNITSHAYSLTM